MGSSSLTYQRNLLLLLFFLFAALAHFPAANKAYARNLSPAPAESPAPAASVVLATCANARYPTLCIRTLSSSQIAATSSPADFAIAAVSVSLASARDAATFLSRLLAASSAAPATLDDCLQLVTDAADLLEATEGELRRLTSRRQLEDALTWASAAMTNQDTCVEGLREGGDDVEEGAAVVDRVSGVCQYISNALHLIGRLASTTGRRL
ncbi:hypothetical protein Taro_054171 [Colocasia esculenta]|uniref:Pectinesterase inhibitor domain-containing protein n=1 Tax=Colocasia esculenta TaxID=4460 RepID=A0A843XMU2_COLES|nr:hypothetical protein [Colocasia esculenta]